MARRTSLDADRLAAAYERDARRLLVYFTRRTYDAQLAVDLVGETYARAFELRARFASDPGDADALAAWVFGIGPRVSPDGLGSCVTFFRRPAGRPARPVPVFGPARVRCWVRTP